MDDRGGGLIGSIAGLLVLLALLLFAVQSLFALFARSAVTDAAYEGARQVAGARVGHDDFTSVVLARQQAERTVRGHLGRFGDGVSLDWSGSSTDTITLTVHAQPPGFLWDALRGAGPEPISRTVRVRVERPR
ncbi:MAG: hypothetical protein F2520_01655 [Actinobacteria bacterium]|uniref:Unannotated protein n=1 Tax=freshwater metagenome TaxID=449393 RepID=A0A6J5Y8X6_9ZZZZ|nr:hypothetical protein [Actinomycetota bacterium]MTA76948.1 hypothetical protein [Actinomycetota bacterium]